LSADWERKCLIINFQHTGLFNPSVENGYLLAFCHVLPLLSKLLKMLSLCMH